MTPRAIEDLFAILNAISTQLLAVSYGVFALSLGVLGIIGLLFAIYLKLYSVIEAPEPKPESDPRPWNEVVREMAVRYQAKYGPINSGAQPESRHPSPSDYDDTTSSHLGG